MATRPMDVREKRKELSTLYVEKRKKLDELKELTSRIRELKRERSELLKRLAELKSERTRVKGEMAKDIEELRLLRSRRSSLLRRVGKPEGELRRIYEELEWKYQTMPTLPREKDRELVSTIERIKAQLLTYEEVRGIDAQISVKEQEVEASRKQLDTLRLSMRSLIERVSNIKQEIINLTGKLEKVGGDLKLINARVESLKEVVRRTSKELAAKKHERILAKLKDLEERAQEALISRKRMVEEAKVKLSRGERLSFEEFKALIESNEG